MSTKFITITIATMQDKRLTPNQKFIISEIAQLSQLDKGCIASNKHFSDLIGITTQGVSKAINQLEKMDYISIDNAQTKRNFGRVITINSGKSAINSGKSAINSGWESKENNTVNNTVNSIVVKTMQERILEFKANATLKCDHTNNNFEFDKFLAYWTEHNENAKKFRSEMQKIFDVKKRWATWQGNNFNNSGNILTKPKTGELSEYEKIAQGFYDKDET